MTAGNFRIPVSAPDLSQRERAYLLEAFDSTWISSTGLFVDRLEQQFAQFAGTAHAISCANGTAALHLALLGLGIGEGDEVIVPDLTYIAAANAVRYVGAEPVFADCHPETWTMDPRSAAQLVGPRTRAVIAVHLFGMPAEINALRRITDAHQLYLIEDAAQAHGATYRGAPVGSFGDVSTFSFYANKIIAAGEGGIVCTSNGELADRVRLYRGQGASQPHRYWFPVTGYNYRMTNLACAIALGQLERFDWLSRARQTVGIWYDQALAVAGLPIKTQAVTNGAEPVLWMYGAVLDDDVCIDRDALIESLTKKGIETRPFFPPLHTLPMFRTARRDDTCAIGSRLGRRGIMLPTHTKLTQADVKEIVNVLATALGAAAPAARV